MATHDSPGCSSLDRRQFLLYRLFSLAGLVPVGAYVVVHLLVNATILDGPATYQSQVDRIHALGIILPLVEWTFIFIPILFHGIVGLVIISGSMPNAAAYPYNGNIRYTLQRATGMIVFAFIILHVWQMHKMGVAFGGGRFDAEHASSTVAEVLTPFSWKLIYGIGVLTAVFHLANGLWTAGITWGIWTTPAAMRRAGWISLVVGLIVGAAGFVSIVGFANTDIKKSQVIEDRLEKFHKMETGAE